MLLGILLAALLTRLSGGGFTPTDMTSPPAFGSAVGQVVDAPGDSDTSGHGHLPRRFGYSERWNKPTFSVATASS